MIYDYEVTTGKGEKLNLSEYKGKVIMVVNLKKYKKAAEAEGSISIFESVVFFF